MAARETWQKHTKMNKGELESTAVGKICEQGEQIKEQGEQPTSQRGYQSCLQQNKNRRKVKERGQEVRSQMEEVPEVLDA